MEIGIYSKYPVAVFFEQDRGIVRKLQVQKTAMLRVTNAVPVQQVLLLHQQQINRRIGRFRDTVQLACATESRTVTRLIIMCTSLITDKLFHPGDSPGDLSAFGFTVCGRGLKEPLQFHPVIPG